MQHHLIIGSGNLGCDLANEAIKCGHKASMILSKPISPATLDQRVDRYYSMAKNYCEIPEETTHIWYTRGYGSIEQAEDNPKEAAFYHLIYPVSWSASKDNEQDFHYFSTCYSNENSFYVQLKKTAEYTLNKPYENSYVHEVQYLYGIHHPMNTFIGKVIKNRPTSLPRNLVSLTPTRWIAEQCIQNDYYFEELNLIPNNLLSLQEWGMKILEHGTGDQCFIDDRDEDSLRYQDIDNISVSEDSCIDLFNRYAPQVIRAARKAIENEKT